MDLAGLLSLLDETNGIVLQNTLSSLTASVDTHWPEIADYIARIEELYESPSLSGQVSGSQGKEGSAGTVGQGVSREMAGLLLAKVYYHLGEFDVAVGFALGAGKLFDLSAGDQFTQTIISIFPINLN